MTNFENHARIEIGQNIARFAYRDEGRWDELRDLFHPSATVSVSWYRGSIAGFIDASRAMEGAPRILTKHWFGVPRVQVKDGRALSEVDVMIMVRSKAGPIEIDVTSYARFFDRFVQCEDGRWRIAERTAIYEKDRIDPVQPSLLFNLVYRLARFRRFPVEYRRMV